VLELSIALMNIQVTRDVTASRRNRS